MAKRSTRKRIERYEKDQSGGGCMWGLINIFDFRHGRPSQKLLSDKKHGSKRVAGGACPRVRLDKLNHSSDIYDSASAVKQSETMSVDTSKMSVKELMEEEMFELDPIKHTSSKVEEDKNQTQQEGHGKRNRWIRTKMSFDLNYTQSPSDKPTHRKYKSLSSLNIDSMVAELCSQIDHQDVNCLNHDQGGKGPLKQSNEEGSSVLEEKLGEATKVLVSHFTDEKNFARDGKVQPSKELLDALNVLNLNKEVFLKLLQDPSSPLVKHIQNLQDHQDSKDENPVEHDERYYKQSFFWRKFKSLERSSSKKSEHAEDVSEKFELKPGPVAPHEIGNGCQSHKASHFFFFEFTKKLKQAMRKEKRNVSSVDKVTGGEGFGMASPSRDHFFIERIPKPSSSSKRRDKVGVGPNEIGFTPEQKISNIYIEAKKHLAEIVGEGADADVDFFGKQVPKSLGRILSYTDYSSSPLCSPRKDGDLNLLTSPRGSSVSKNGQARKEIASQQVQEEIDASYHGLVDQERDNELCADANKILNDVETPKSELSGDLDPECTEIESSIPAVHEAISQDEVEIIPSSDFVSERRTIALDTVPESCSSSINNGKEVDGALKDCAEEGQPMSLNLDTEGYESPSSPLASSSVCLMFKEVQNQDAEIERSDEPSPISVLVPILDDDNPSPPGVKSPSATQQFLPRKIKFEEQLSSSVPSSRTWTWEEEKTAVFELVEVVMQESGLTWDELLERSLFSDHILEPSFFDELEFIPDLCFYDPELLFDLIVEVLNDTSRMDFNGISSSTNPDIGSELKGKDVSDVVREGVQWHLQPEKSGRTLDQTIARDYVKSRTWMDFRLATEEIGISMEEAITEDLIGDILFDCFLSYPEEEGFPLSPVESAENESQVCL